MKFEGIRLAYVHLSVTTPRASSPRGVAAEATPLARDTGDRRRDRAATSRPAERAGGLAA